MAYGNYITPSQAGIYVGPWHVDDAYSIEWQYRDSRTPIYSYFKEEVANVAAGKKIVTGTLAINFRFPGYLEAAVKESRKKLVDFDSVRQMERDGQSYVDSFLNRMRNGTVNERLELLMDAAAKGPIALRKASSLAYLSSLGWSSGGLMRNIEYPSMFDVQKPELDIVPVDIWVHFGDIDEVHVAQRIEDVVFVGESQQIQAGATAAGGLSASGINLLEVYSFWAKGVTKVTVDPSRT